MMIEKAIEALAGAMHMETYHIYSNNIETVRVSGISLIWIKLTNFNFNESTAQVCRAAVN